MAKDWAKKFYKGVRWLKCRSSYISKRKSIDGGICEVCKEELGYIVHHKILLNDTNINDPEIALNHNYLEYVCKKCHDRKEGHFVKRKKKKIIRDGFKFNSDGEIVKT